MLPKIAVTDIGGETQDGNILRIQDDIDRWNDSAGHDNVNIKSPTNTAQ